MPFSRKADEFAWSPEESSPGQPPVPVDHADEFENITAWWWNPEAANLSSSPPPEAGEESAAEPSEAEPPTVRNRWAGQALGVYRRLAARTNREILTARGLVEEFATDEALREILAALAPEARAEIRREVSELVESRLAALEVWLPKPSPAEAAEDEPGHEHQKKLAFAGPDRRPDDAEFVPPDRQYDRLRLTDVVIPFSKSRTEKFFLKHYNELLEAAYDKTLREFGLDPFVLGSAGRERRLEVTDEEVNIYEVCRATYEKMDATPTVAALAIALGELLV